jgi:hypothetical protein
VTKQKLRAADFAHLSLSAIMTVAVAMILVRIGAWKNSRFLPFLTLGTFDTIGELGIVISLVGIGSGLMGVLRRSHQLLASGSGWVPGIGLLAALMSAGRRGRVDATPLAIVDFGREQIICTGLLCFWILGSLVLCHIVVLCLHTRSPRG